LPERLTSFTLTIPRWRGRLRVIPLVYGVVLLLWSSLEDNSVLPVTLLGSGLAFLMTLLWVIRRFGGRTFAARNGLLGASVLGATTGLLGALASAALMLVKDGLHSDLYPDYPFSLIVDTLARAPLWALAGIFAGIGLLLAWWAVKRKVI
jgi:hypothetical protein